MSSSAAVASADTTAAGAISAALHAGNQSSAAEKKKLKPVTTKKIIHTKHKITTTRMGFTDAESIANENSEKNQKKGRSRKPRRIIPNEKEYIPEDEQPTARDIVGGRGGRSNHHPGNRPYWVRILESRAEYTNCRSDLDKSRIANGILMDPT
ncbi:unnamed protein product [Pseudo-nitzschia multistriata]|uniref:DUF6824 domain-containing protein n=1 Tax=Pseudo-nitzschia multistriata TaxID=183589 RepID=A0A448Z7P3_9STRA|nr:unnamed protein product [Pseudo-nitzschia multistriata]